MRTTPSMRNRHVSGLAVACLLVLMAAPRMAATEYFIGGVGGISWADAMLAVQPGDIITFRNGAYSGPLLMDKSGNASLPILIRAENMLGAQINAVDSLGAMEIISSYVTVDGLVLDGKFKLCDVLRLRNDQTNVTVRNCEVRNAGGVGGGGSDGIDIVDVNNVLIEACHVHHCLASASGARDDSHGIAMDSSNWLTIRKTEIDHCSGDAFQVGSMHTAWDQVLIEDCLFWHGPLASAMAGFAAGSTPGENAVDTKTRASGTSYITIRRSVAYGFKNGITNQAAFNIKELVNCTLDGNIVYGSEIAFRLRDPAKVSVKNCVAYGNDYGCRFESANATVYHCTFGAAPQVALFQGDASPIPPVKNSLFLAVAGTVPAGNGNLSSIASAVVNTAANDYRPRAGSPAIDYAALLATVTTDLPGNPRSVGPLADAGAYEYGSNLYAVVTGPGSAGGNLPPAITTAAYSTPSPVVSANTSVLRAVATDPDAGPSALTYTWSKISGPGTIGFSPNGTGAAATTTATYSASGTYAILVTVSDGSATVTSTIASLSVTLPAAGVAPTISTPPASQTVTAGMTATFSVVAAGTATLTYQWQKNTANIAGATASSYTTPATLLADNGATYRVVVTNGFGSVTSASATLTVTASGVAPTVSTPPASQTVTAGLTATFSVVASGTATLTYQWQKNTANIAGATSSSYTTPAALLADNGATYRVVVTNGFGSVTSASATLTVNAAGNPVTASVASVSLSAAPGSTTPVSTTFTLTNTSGSAITITLADGLVWLTTSPAATVTINPGQTITVTVTANPTGLSGVVSGTLTLTNSPGGQVRNIPISFNLSAAASASGGKRGGCAVSTNTTHSADLLFFALALTVVALFRYRSAVQH